MFQQAFGFLSPALTSSGPAPGFETPALSVSGPPPWLAASAPPGPPLAPSFERFALNLAWVLPCPERPLLNSARVGTILVRLALLVPSCEGSLAGLALLRTASHTQLQASSTKNLSPCRSIGCASRFVRPYSDAAPAEPQTKELPRYIP